MEAKGLLGEVLRKGLPFVRALDEEHDVVERHADEPRQQSVFDFGDAMIFAMCFPNVLGLYFMAREVKEGVRLISTIDPMNEFTTQKT